MIIFISTIFYEHKIMDPNTRAKREAELQDLLNEARELKRETETELISDGVWELYN